MSRSRNRRAAGESAPAPREEKRWYQKTGWLLAVSLLCYGIVAVGLRLALGAGFGALFRAWGVDAGTAARAPRWAQLVWRWHGSFVTAAVSAALIAASLVLRRMWRGAEPAARALDAGGSSSGSRRAGGGQALSSASAGCESRKAAPWWRGLGSGALAGLAAAAALLILGLAFDSLRMEPGSPKLHPSLFPLLLVSLLAAFAEELFTKGVLYDGLAGRWGSLWATAAATAVFFLSSGGLAGNVISGVNVLLLGLLCCAVHGRCGLWADVGLRWGWSAATVFLFGFGGGEGSLMRFYAVSEALLTGGDAGPVYGLYATVALAAGIAWLLCRKGGKKKRLPAPGGIGARERGRGSGEYK